MKAMFSGRQSNIAGAGAAVGGTGSFVDFGADDNDAAGTDVEWVNKPWVRQMLRVCAFISLVSVNLNTKKTFDFCDELRYVTFFVDAVIAVLFTAEMIAKFKARGIIRGKNPYLRDIWCQFDCAMVIFLIVSVILQIFELQSQTETGALSILRSPRPFILIRVFRVVLKLRLPRNRVESIFKRSSSQIKSVVIFFLFFMTLYALVGVQFFGEMNHHCVMNGANVTDLKESDLMVPDTLCDPTIKESAAKSGDGYQCPKHMQCVNVSVTGFNVFDNILTSFFTVYQSGSQEGWVFIMYRAKDSLDSWRALVYFVTLIFFLAWLVKNVFIAVLIETFAEIRVQFQQSWTNNLKSSGGDSSKVLSSDGCRWKLVAVDASTNNSMAPKFLIRICKHNAFNLFFLLLVSANAITSALLTFNIHNEQEVLNRKIDWVYYAEVGYTVMFDLEALFKIFCYGFTTYISRSLHKFELFLAVGTTLHILPDLYRSIFTYFMVLRVVRLIRASPVLENFCWKIFGPGKKLGSLVLFTMCLLIIMSSISLQLFCSIEDFSKFSTFPQVWPICLFV